MTATNLDGLPMPPVRLCCGYRHFGVGCPDGKAMCCLCFERFYPSDLDTDIDGDLVDICKKCAYEEVRHDQ